MFLHLEFSFESRTRVHINLKTCYKGWQMTLRHGNPIEIGYTVPYSGNAETRRSSLRQLTLKHFDPILRK